MVDRLTSEQRSAHMARIRRCDTKPEWIVRRVLHRLGYRFRLQWKAAPGRPDIAFPARRKIIFVHGCFWHQHEGCKLGRLPATRTDFWREKFRRNRERDARNLTDAAVEGWQVMVVWECETKDEMAVGKALATFLGDQKMR